MLHSLQCEISPDWSSALRGLPLYGGIVTTASNLLFTGEMDGDFDAFDAKTGKKLWHYFMGVGVCTPPITYRVKGVQCRGGRPRPGIS